MNIYDNFTKEQLIEKIEYLYKEIDKLHNALEGKITEFRSEEVEKVQVRIDKAIEYIRQLEFESEELYDISEIARLELLDILKGVDKE